MSKAVADLENNLKQLEQMIKTLTTQIQEEEHKIEDIIKIEKENEEIRSHFKNLERALFGLLRGAMRPQELRQAEYRWQVLRNDHERHLDEVMAEKAKK